MIERIIILLLAYGSILLYDRSHWKSVSNNKEKAVYIILMLFSLYFSIDYLMNLNFPGLYELVDLIFTDTARVIDKWMALPKK